MIRIQHLPHHRIDKNAWDDCIDHAPNGLIYALSWYLDAVSPGWEALVIIEENQYQVCFPVPVRQKWGMKYVWHPSMCQQLGLFFRTSPSSDVVSQLWQKLLSRYRYIPALSCNTSNKEMMPSYPRVFIQKRHTHELPLNKSYEQIRHNYRRDRKYRLKQAQDVRWTMHDDISPLIDIFLKDTLHRIPGASADSVDVLLRQLFTAVKRHGRYELHYTQDQQGNYTSGCWFVLYRHRIIYLTQVAEY